MNCCASTSKIFVELESLDQSGEGEYLVGQTVAEFLVAVLGLEEFSQVVDLEEGYALVELD